ncbi:hypothetical protein [Paenibacillus tyrfis]|uniref:hypothetical protein n=1 Tax=Paenibacillus tyrfis TaxID=1501230 RepID=UPI000B593228|nr:hypothetical protein [Paenibacillus tyrfis]
MATATTFFIYFFGLLALLEWIDFFLFKKIIYKPVKRIIIRKLLSKYETTEMLYRAYREMNEEEFKITKLKLKFKDPDSTFVQQLIDLVSKLVVTVSVAFAVSLTTTATAFLNYLNSNKESSVENKIDVPQNLQNIFKIFKQVTENNQILFEFCLILAGYAIIHFLIVSRKKYLHKMHLTIVEEVAEENKS